MANQLKMAKIHSILTLHSRGWSYRRIAHALGIHRETVARYIRLAENGAKPANPPPGSDECFPNEPPQSGDQNRPNPPPGSSGPDSLCEPFRESIIAALERGLSNQRIWQDLKAEHGFGGEYDSVKTILPATSAGFATAVPTHGVRAGRRGTGRFRDGRPGNHFGRQPRKVWRKGQAATSASVPDRPSAIPVKLTAKRFTGRRPKSSSAAWRTPSGISAGVPKTLVIDNLKAAVTRADWYDPDLNPKILAFCEHYGTVILPTRPYTPRHKGKVERGVGYAQSNALKGRTFESLEQQNRFLLEWERSVADTRIHGTTRRQVGKPYR